MNRLLTAAAALSAAIAVPQLAAAQTAAQTGATAAPSTTSTPNAAQSAVPATGPATSAAAAPTAAPAAAATSAKVTPHGDIIETARASGQFTTFIKAADATNLTQVLKSQPNLTVFAPTDAAFAALPPGQLQQLMSNPTALQKLLTHHVVNARVDSSKIKGAKGPVPSVAGDQVLLDGSGEALKVDNATIVQSDVMASNGVLHVVDHVLTPGFAATASAESAGAAASATAPEPATPAQPAATAKPAAPAKK